MTVRAATPEECALLTRRTGYTTGPEFRGIVAEVGGRVAGLVGFDGWTPNAVWAHVALESPAACRGLLRAAFSYAFEEAGRTLVLASIRESNLRSRRLAMHLGFRLLGRIRDGWAAGEDVVLLEMRRHECRWIGGSHG